MKAVDGFCGTSYAAKLLGLSVGTVQSLVESQELTAWKTQGGHRRIAMPSLLAYQEAHLKSPITPPHAAGRLHVMVVEDDPDTQKMYQAHFDRWALPLEIVVYASAMEALLDLPVLNPRVLLTDLHMPDMNGFKLIQTIREHKLFAELPIIALTGMTTEAIEKEGGLLKDVLVLNKPIDMDWLKGFFEGMVSMKTVQAA